MPARRRRHWGRSLRMTEAGVGDDNRRADNERPFRRQPRKRHGQLSHGRELRRQYGEPRRHDDEGNQRTSTRADPRRHYFRHGVRFRVPYPAGDEKRQQRKTAGAGSQPPEGGRSHLPGKPGHAYGGGTAYAGSRKGEPRMYGARRTAVHEKGRRSPRMPGIQQAESKQQRRIKAEDQQDYRLRNSSLTGVPPWAAAESTALSTAAVSVSSSSSVMTNGGMT